MLSSLKVEADSLILAKSTKAPRVKVDEIRPSSPVLAQPNLAIKQEEHAGLFVRSSFLSDRIIAKPICNDGSMVNILEQPLIFPPARPTQPSRQDTLVKGLELQTRTPEIYRELSCKIVQMVSKRLNCAVDSDRLPNRDSELTEDVAQLVKHFVVKNFAPTEFIFKAPSSHTSNSKSPKLTSQFYASILPCDLAKVAAQQIVQRNRRSPIYHCIGYTKSSKMRDRCRKESKYDEVTFSKLLKELTTMARPRHFSQLTRILSDLIQMLYCDKFHLKMAECNFSKVYDHFTQDETSVHRNAELDSFELWLSQLEHGVQTVSHTSMSSNAIEGDLPTAITHGVTAPVQISGLQSVSTPLFIFETVRKNDTLKERNKSQHTFFSGSQSLQPYSEDPKIRKLTTSEIISKIREQVTKSISQPDLLARGSIYVFRHSTGFGYHKIGRSKDVEHRLKQWAESCKYEIDERADILNRINREALHPHRLELLIHTELITKRFKVVECGCDDQTNHQEWFDVDANHAQKIIAKWTLWMQQEPSPYDEEGKFRKDTELPPLGVDDYAYLDNDEKQKLQMAWEQASGRRKSGRYSEDFSEEPAASTHSMTLRSTTKSRKRVSET